MAAATQQLSAQQVYNKDVQLSVGTSQANTNTTNMPCEVQQPIFSRSRYRVREKMDVAKSRILRLS